MTGTEQTTRAAPEPVLVIGCGLIGTSVALAATRAGATVHLSDERTGQAAIAESLGAGTTRPPEQVGIVVVAVPPDHVAAVVTEAVRTWPAAAVTDVASVKRAPLAALEHCDTDIGRYVGSHPMAGSERSGPMAASASLFEGRAWAVTPHPGSQPYAVEAVRDLAGACGAVVTLMDPAAHDAAVARVSHLPHVMSVLVAARLNDASSEQLSLAGQGLRDVTRVAAGDAALWRQILALNAGPVAGLLRDVRADLEVLLSALEAPAAADGVASLLSRGVSGSAAVPGKHGIPEPETVTVYVSIPDAPGALARLFADAEESQVNVEDVRIDHEIDRRVGVAGLDVLSGRAEALVAVLTERGWTAHR